MQGGGTRSRFGPGVDVAGLVAVALLGIGSLAGCAPTPPEEPVDLVVFDRWRIADADEDPFPEHRAASKRICDPSGFRAEDGALEVESGRCGYVTALQENRAEVAPGQTMSLLWWHLVLVGGQEAHVAVTIDGIPLVDLSIPLPASAEVYEVQLPAPRPIPEGALVAFHLHNHGANSYRLGHLRALPDEEE